MGHERQVVARRLTVKQCLLSLAFLLAVANCAPESSPTTQVPTAAPTLTAASIRIAYTSDSLGYTEPRPATD